MPGFCSSVDGGGFLHATLVVVVVAVALADRQPGELAEYPNVQIKDNRERVRSWYTAL